MSGRRMSLHPAHDKLVFRSKTETGAAEVTQQIAAVYASSGQITSSLQTTMKNPEKAHLISDRLKEKVMQALPTVQQVIIHYEPGTIRNLHCAFALKNKNKTLSDHFGRAPYFALRTYHLETGQTVDQEILANPYQERAKGKGLRVAGGNEHRSDRAQRIPGT